MGVVIYTQGGIIWRLFLPQSSLRSSFGTGKQFDRFRQKTMFHRRMCRILSAGLKRQVC